MPATIIVAVEDLFFRAKIQEAARQQGVTIETVRLSGLVERVGRADSAAVIVDLNDPSGGSVEAIRALRRSSNASQTKIVGFVSHVQSELIEAAKQAGCDQVLPRSRFSQQLAELLATLVRGAEHHV